MPGSPTKPENAVRPRGDNGDRLLIFRRLLGMFPVGSLIDLGAGHGKFALVAADMGWQVTAQDARGDRFPDAPQVTWQVGDVRDVDLGGFDVISCLGLFYHLTLEDQLGLLDKAAGTALILDTHVANDKPWPKLSAPVTVQGYRGRHYAEPTDMAPISTASWGNELSFWPRPRALYRMLNERGYEVLTSSPWYLLNRTFFVCVPI